MHAPLLRLESGKAARTLAALLLLGACADPLPQDYRDVYALHVLPETVTLPANFLVGDPVAGEAGGRLDALAAGYLDRGHGPIVVAARSAGPNDQRAAGHVRAVTERLIADGIPLSAIQVAMSASGSADLVTLSYVRYSVVLPVCGDWTTSLSVNFNNVTHPDFGCAIQHNIGLMAADPADLIGGRPAGPTDAQNASRIIVDYRSGQATGQTQSTLQNSGAAVSSVGR